MAKRRSEYLTGTHIYTMYRCEHALYLELFGDLEKKREPDDALKLLFRKGNEHEEAMAAEFGFDEVVSERADFAAAYQDTLKLMRRGAPGVYQGVLMDGRYLGKPDLMRKVRRPSDLGEWSYEISDIKSSKKIKLEQVMQVTFYSLLLERAQGVRPQKGFIVLGNGREQSFLIDDYYWMLLDLLDEADEIRSGERATFYHIDRSCDSCSWSDLCREQAAREEDLSLVFGLHRTHKELLRSRGVTDIRGVAEMDVRALSRTRGLNEAGLTRLKRQAGVMLSGKPVVLEKPALPLSSCEVYFDMESDPFSETEYLFGLLICRGGGETLEYHMARTPDEEHKAFLGFMARMKRLMQEEPGLVVYHYHHYEPTHVEKLVEQYGGEEMLKDLQDRMVDLLPVIRKSVVLPVTSYSLKDVARFLGFNWRGEDASASQSVVWYNAYQNDGDPLWLERIVEYNQDDLLATRVVKKWLASL